MGFGRKKAEVTAYSQEDVSRLATEALRKTRSTRVRLPLRVTLETPLLVQRWTTKAVRQMLGKMVNMPEPRSPKDLMKDYEDSWYRNDRGEAVLPCRVMKACIVEGAISTNGVVTKADLKRNLRVLGYTSPLRDAEKTMDVRIVKNVSSVDVRARARFGEGTTFDVVLEFGAPLTPDQVIAAVEAAGATIGLCEWRPEKGGDFGTFRIDPLDSDEATVTRVLEACSSPENEFDIPPEMLRAFNAVAPEKLTDGQRKVKSLIDLQEATPKNKEPTNGTVIHSS